MLAGLFIVMAVIFLVLGVSILCFGIFDEDSDTIFLGSFELVLGILFFAAGLANIMSWSTSELLAVMRNANMYSISRKARK